MELNENVRATEQVRRFRRRLGRLLVLDLTLKLLAVSGFAWGTVVLAARVGLEASEGALLTGLAMVSAGAFVAALFQGLQAMPSPVQVRALLDRRQNRGGLLMAQAETDLGSWQPASDGDPPRLVWRSGAAWTFLLGAAVFVAAAFLVPAGTIDASTERPLDIGEEIEDLVESLAVLEEEELLEQEEAERLELELENLAEKVSGDDPARAWETLDQLRQTAEQTATEAAEAALREGEELAAAMEVATALSETYAALSETYAALSETYAALSETETDGPTELAAEALSDLADMSARAAREHRLLDSSAAETLRRAVESRDPGQLRDALGDARAGVEAKLERLHQAGLIDLETLLEAKKALESNDGALSDYLEENGYRAAGEYGRRPGRGGVDRGRADAPMTWGEESASHGAEFEEQVLDPASRAALEKNVLLGLQAADPTAGGRRPRSPGVASALDPATAGGGAAHKQTVLPRHRGAVRRFFERDPDASSSKENE